MTQELGLREVFEQVNTRLGSVETRVENLRVDMVRRFEVAEAKGESLRMDMDRRFGLVEARVESLREEMDRRFGSVEARVESLREEINGLRREVMTNFRWTTGLLIGILFPMWLTIILAIVFRG